MKYFENCIKYSTCHYKQKHSVKISCFYGFRVTAISKIDFFINSCFSLIFFFGSFPVLYKTIGNFKKRFPQCTNYRFTFQPKKLLKLKIESLFRQVIVYTDTQKKLIIKKIHNIVWSIHSSLRSESKIIMNLLFRYII